MDGATLVGTVRSELATELDRLGSEKSLLSATEARLEVDPVLVTTATVLTTARTRLVAWEEAADADAAATLAVGVATLEDGLEAVRAELDGEQAELADLEAPLLSLSADGEITRVAAGTVGLPLVLDRLFLQVVSFFVNEADEARADLFRDLRESMTALLADGREGLDALCTADADWEQAEAAASGVVEAAYDDYVRRLDAMGFDPKPIC